MGRISLIFLVSIILATISCSKDNQADPLEIKYQARTGINEFELVGDRISYAEIIGYDSSNYTFLIDSNAGKKIRSYYYPTTGLPFSIWVLGEPVCSGIFFPAYSSSLPCGSYIEPYSFSNKYTMNISYSPCLQSSIIIDNRNDSRIISILKRNNKLLKISL